MKNFDASAKPSSVLDLDLPDWSGMDRFTPRLTTEAALRYNEALLREAPPELRLRSPLPKCEVEFVF